MGIETVARIGLEFARQVDDAPDPWLGGEQSLQKLALSGGGQEPVPQVVDGISTDVDVRNES